MNKPLTPVEIAALPVADRLELIEQLWDSLESEAADLAVPDWHRAELDRRLAAHAASPDVALPWDEVKAEMPRSIAGP